MTEEKKTGPVDGFFLLLAEKFDGKKTLTGIVLIVGGLATIIFTPDYKEAGASMLAAGIPMLFVGLTHKAMKKVEQ
jgi:hypothetical protein